jgi:hypothetical protein
MNFRYASLIAVTFLLGVVSGALGWNWWGEGLPPDDSGPVYAVRQSAHESVAAGGSGRPCSQGAASDSEPAMAEADRLRRRLAGAQARLAELEARNASLEAEVAALTTMHRLTQIDGVPNVESTGIAAGPVEPLVGDLPPFNAEALLGTLDPAAVDWIAERFRDYHRRILSLEFEADAQGGYGLAPEGLEGEKRAIRDQLRLELDPEDYLAGLYATAETNRVSVVGGELQTASSLQPGDVVLEVGGERVFDAGQIDAAATRFVVSGAPASVVVLRAGQEIVYPVEVLTGDVKLTGESVSPEDYYAAE